MRVLRMWRPVHLTHGHIIMLLLVTRCVLPTATQQQRCVAWWELADRRRVTERRERNCSQLYLWAGKSQGPIGFLWAGDGTFRLPSILQSCRGTTFTRMTSSLWIASTYSCGDKMAYDIPVIKWRALLESHKSENAALEVCRNMKAK